MANFTFKKWWFAAGALVSCTLVLCTNAGTENKTASAYLNLADSVAYVGMQTCRSCHQNIYETFIHTDMGQSFDLATRDKSAATYGEHALVYDKKSDFYYRPYFRDSVLFIEEFRLENGDTVHKRTEQMAYIIGSGQHTNSHILNINGYIFQAPITFYTQKGRWDMAPGFGTGKNERFSRFLADECITCHNHFPDFEKKSLNKYTAMPTGIECERCHGPGEIHVREKLAGNIVDTSKMTDYTIVNPANLPRDLQMDLCQRCHLQGIPVLEEGKTFFDFKPGMKLSAVMNVFLPRYSNSHEKFIMASQADRLRLSECFKKSEMTCITCHNPHKSVKATNREIFNQKCESCHSRADAKTCSASQPEREAAGNDCSGCHMPVSGSSDIPHVRITDHFISKKNTTPTKSKIPETTEKPAFLGLQILTKEHATALDMARGYLALYDKYMPAPMVLDSALHYLKASKLPEAQTFKTWVHYYFTREDFPSLAAFSQKIPFEKLDDGWTAYRIGEAFFKLGKLPEAEHYFAKATEVLTFNLDFQEKLGTVQVALGKLKEAEQTFDFILKENPKRQVALCNLGYAKVLQGNWEAGEQLYDRAIQLDPDYEQALLNKAAARLFKKDKAGAQKLLNRILKINPANEQVKKALEM